MSDEKLRGAGHRSFLHHDSYQALWQRELLGLATTTAGNSNNSGDGVRLTSVRHRREDSDDIRSDSSSSSDTSNPCNHEDTEDSDASSHSQSGAYSDEAFCGGSVLLMNQAVS